MGKFQTTAVRIKACGVLKENDEPGISIRKVEVVHFYREKIWMAK